MNVSLSQTASPSKYRHLVHVEPAAGVRRAVWCPAYFALLAGGLLSTEPLDPSDCVLVVCRSLGRGLVG